MNKIDKKINLLEDVVFFIEKCPFNVKEIDFNNKKEAFYIYAYKERIVSLGKSCLILFKSEQYIETQILARSALEALFYMLSLIRDPKFLKVLAKDHIKQKLTMFNDLSSNKKVSQEFNFSQQYLDDCVDGIKKDIEKYNDYEDMSVQESAKKAGLLSMYSSSFRILSLATHSKAKILDEQFDLVKGRLKYKQKQNKSNADTPVDASIAILMIMSFSLVGYANVNDNKTIKSLENFSLQYTKLTKKSSFKL